MIGGWRGLAGLSVASALQAAANAVAGLLATRALGPQERGLMVLGLTIGSVFGLIGGFGSGAAFRARLPAAPGVTGRRSLVSAFTWCSIGGAAVAVAASVATTVVSATWIDPSLRTPAMLVATAAFTVGQVLLTQVPDAWFADGRFRRGGLSAAGLSAGGLAGVVLGLVFADTAATVLQAQAAGMVLAGVLEVAALRRVGLVRVDTPAPGLMPALLRQGAPALGLTVGLAMTLRADRYVLGMTSGAAAVGVYSLAATLAEVARLLPAAVGQLYLRHTSTGSGAARFRSAISLAVIAAAAAGGIVAVAAWLLIEPVFGPEFRPARELLLVLALAEICLAPYSVASRGLLGGGWTGVAGTLGVTSSLGALVVYLASAEWAGVYGLAAGSVLVYLGLSIATAGLLRRRLRIGTTIERT